MHDMRTKDDYLKNIEDVEKNIALAKEIADKYQDLNEEDDENI